MAFTERKRERELTVVFQASTEIVETDERRNDGPQQSRKRERGKDRQRLEDEFVIRFSISRDDEQLPHSPRTVSWLRDADKREKGNVAYLVDEICCP